MTLVDTSVWVDHFRHNDALLGDLLAAERVAMHPFVIGELMLGHRSGGQSEAFEHLVLLPQLTVATHLEVTRLVEARRLGARGVGWVDVHLLASVVAAGDTRLLTRDRKLARLAQELGVALPDAPLND